ncbi:MAG: Holliday junction resolvase-like protein [Candidatus Woesearchaeota archaeon]
MPPAQIKQLIEHLSRDNNIIAECPHCQENFKLGNSGLFYGEELPAAAKDFITSRNEIIKQMKEELKKMKLKATDQAAKKSVAINFGKIVEKVAPALKGFPMHKNDCRPIMEPIDYIVFSGLTKKGIVDKLAFIDIKTGSSQLNVHEKQVKEAVEKGKVEVETYG